MPLRVLCGTSRWVGVGLEEEEGWYGGGGSVGSILLCIFDSLSLCLVFASFV
jgi:hypothetical protein